MSEQDPNQRPPQPPGSEQPSAPPPSAPPPPPSSAPPPSSEPPPPPSSPPPGGGYGQQYGGQPPAGYGAPGQLSLQDERTWGMLAHISAILGAIVALSFLGPLIVLLVQGNKSPFVRKQAVEALNFQITTYIAAIVSAILIIVIIGFFLLLAVGIAWLVLTIMAGLAANRGEDYRYPFNIRLVK